MRRKHVDESVPWWFFLLLGKKARVCTYVFSSRSPAAPLIKKNKQKNKEHQARERFV